MSWSEWGWSTLSNITTKTVSSVQSSIEIASTYVKPTIDTVTETTSQIINQVADAIAIDEAEKAAQEKKNQSLQPQPPQDRTPGAGGSETQQDRENIEEEEKNLKNEENNQGGEPLLDYIDSTIDNSVLFIASSAGYISGFVKRGVETVANTDVVGQSLDALEKVSSVISSNLSLEEVQKKPNSRPNISKTEIPQFIYEKPAKPFSIVFEETGGITHLQSLENLSFKCIMKTQQIYLKLNSDQREAVDANNEKIQEEFKLEIQGDHHIVPPQLSIITENITISIVDTIAQYKSTKDKLNDINYIREIIGANSFQSEETIIQTIGDVIKLFGKIEEECILTLSKLSTLSILQLLRVGEFLVAITEGKSPEKVQADKFIEFSRQLCLLCAYFDQEINAVSTLYIDHLQKIIQILSKGLEEKDFQNYTKSCIISRDQVRNNIYIYVGNAVSNLEEGKKSLLNIAKLVLFSEYEIPPK